MGASAADSAGDRHDRHGGVTGDLGRRNDGTRSASHRRRVESYYPLDPPSIDVFLPSAGEDLAVLANTYYHVSRLEWAGEITVYVLDDSAREAVRDLAWEYGFRYLTRPESRVSEEGGQPAVRVREFDRRLHRHLRRGFRPATRLPPPVDAVHHGRGRRDRSEPAVLRYPSEDELGAVRCWGDADSVLSLGAASAGPQRRSHLCRYVRDLSALRAGVERRIRPDRAQ